MLGIYREHIKFQISHSFNPVQIPNLNHQHPFLRDRDAILLCDGKCDERDDHDEEIWRMDFAWILYGISRSGRVGPRGGNGEQSMFEGEYIYLFFYTIRYFCFCEQAELDTQTT